jgi:hypothetical protein
LLHLFLTCFWVLPLILVPQLSTNRFLVYSMTFNCLLPLYRLPNSVLCIIVLLPQLTLPVIIIPFYLLGLGLLRPNRKCGIISIQVLSIRQQFLICQVGILL